MTDVKKKVVSLQRTIDFAQFLNEMTSGEPVLLNDKDTPPWFQDGLVYQVGEANFMYHLEVLPPRWIEDDTFAFGEGTGPFQLFWKRGKMYFGRQLTAEETFHLCRLSGTSLFE